MLVTGVQTCALPISARLQPCTVSGSATYAKYKYMFTSSGAFFDSRYDKSGAITAGEAYENATCDGGYEAPSTDLATAVVTGTPVIPTALITASRFRMAGRTCTPRSPGMTLLPAVMYRKPAHQRSRGEIEIRKRK